jgi:hypothetical protein
MIKKLKTFEKAIISTLNIFDGRPETEDQGRVVSMRSGYSILSNNYPSFS